MPRPRPKPRRGSTEKPRPSPGRGEARWSPPSAPAGGVVLSPPASAAVLRGHPWVWREGIARGSGGAAGDPVELRDREGRFVGRGLWDPDSPIAVRVYTRSEREAIDVELFERRLSRALARRAPWLSDPGTTAFRLCHGEGDRLPGLVVDRYGDVAVVRLDGALLDPWIERVARRIFPVLEAHGIRSLARRAPRGDRGPDEGQTEPLLGPAPPETTVVLEGGIRMVVDLARGQKTGAFLDQRDNRARVRAMASGRRVLNLFSYAGGFSTAAAVGGATRVTSVDIAHGAHRAAQLSMRENGLDPTAHEFVTADAFAFLDAARVRGATWDLVISDPPSFAPSEKARPRAIAAYRKLHAGCAAVLAPGGILCAASCSSHVGPDEFLGTLDDAALGRADLSVVSTYGPPADHPIVAGWPEGRYLKFVVLA